MRPTLQLLVAAALLPGALGCSNDATPAPYFLGHVANLSGPDRAGEQAIRLAVEQVNKNGLPQPLGGPPLHVRHGDTRGQLDAAEAEAIRLATVNRVLGLIGGTSAEEVQRLEYGHVPVLTPLGYRPPGASEMVFALGVPPEQQ